MHHPPSTANSTRCKLRKEFIPINQPMISSQANTSTSGLCTQHLFSLHVFSISPMQSNFSRYTDYVNFSFMLDNLIEGKMPNLALMSFSPSVTLSRRLAH